MFRQQKSFVKSLLFQDVVTIMLRKQLERREISNENGYHDKSIVVYIHITNCKGVNYLVDKNIGDAERGNLTRKVSMLIILRKRMYH